VRQNQPKQSSETLTSIQSETLEPILCPKLDEYKIKKGKSEKPKAKPFKLGDVMKNPKSFNFSLKK